MKIIDASVAIKWVRREEEFSEIAVKIQTDHLDNIDKILVPRLILYEIANALATKSDTTPKYVRSGLNILFESKLEIYHESEKEILEAAKLAKKHKTSVYDMLYAVIAKENKCMLITADENFVAKTGFKFVKHIGQV